MIKEIINSILNKLSPTASQLHVDVPINSKEDRIKKLKSDYEKIYTEFQKIKDKNSTENTETAEIKEELTDNKEDEELNRYRGVSF